MRGTTKSSALWAGTVLGPRTPPRVSSAQSRFKVTGLVNTRLAFQSFKPSVGRNPARNENVHQATTRHNDRRNPLACVFEKNFRDNWSRAKDGAKIIVSTVASNLRDCPPFCLTKIEISQPDLQKSCGEPWTDAAAIGSRGHGSRR